MVVTGQGKVGNKYFAKSKGISQGVSLCMSQRKLTYMKEIQGTVKSLEYLVLVLFAMKDADTF